MITQCARCGHEINTDTEAGSEQGVTRGWDGPEEGYRDYHRLCRDLSVTERREERRAGQAQPSSSSRRRDSGKVKAQPVAAAAVADEMD